MSCRKRLAASASSGLLSRLDQRSWALFTHVRLPSREPDAPRALRRVDAVVPYCEMRKVYADICAKLCVSGGPTGRLEAACVAQKAREPIGWV